MKGSLFKRKGNLVMNAVLDNEIHILWDMAENQETVEVESIDAFQPRRVYDFIKRLADIIMSICAIIVLFVPMLIIALLISADSKGNPIYSQTRLGKDQKPFKIYKFRSMIIDAEKDGAQWATDDDPRVTDFGRTLRNTRLDELPQLFNILKGDMSFVGPRPERPEFYDVFDTYIIGFRQRMLIKPGLTGYAQVNGGYDLKPEEKIVYDIEYIKNRSVKMDVKCVLKTIRIVFTREGAK